MPIGNISDESIRKYNSLVEVLFNKIGSNNQENDRLAKMRDSLLPKLMSGEIDVSGIKI
jgi:type I restriction enzyme S subunit